MGTRVRTCGNSLAQQNLHLLADSPVQPAVRDQPIVVESLVAEGLTLEDLLLQVTDDNRHDEVSTGRSVGLEAW